MSDQYSITMTIQNLDISCIVTPADSAAAPTTSNFLSKIILNNPHMSPKKVELVLLIIGAMSIDYLNGATMKHQYNKAPVPTPR